MQIEIMQIEMYEERGSNRKRHKERSKRTFRKIEM